MSPFLNSDSFDFSASPKPQESKGPVQQQGDMFADFSADAQEMEPIDLEAFSKYETQCENERDLQGLDLPEQDTTWDVVRLMRENSPLLTTLHVLPYDSLAEVAGALPANTCLTSLTCSLDTPDEFRAMAFAIARDQSLKHLSIDWPHLVLSADNDQMAEAEAVLAESFLTNQGVTDLIVRSSDAMFRAIVANQRIERATIETGTKGNVAILAEAEHLKYLRIGWGQSNELDAFLEKLIDAARDHALQEFDLCSPGGRYKGAQICEFLKRTSRLNTFSLRGRFSSPENDISLGVRCNTSLTKLAIHGLNSDPVFDRSELCTAISEHPLLKFVELRNVFMIRPNNFLSLVQTPMLETLHVTGCGMWGIENEDVGRTDEMQSSWKAACDIVNERSKTDRPIVEIDISSNVFLNDSAEEILRDAPNVQRFIMAGCRPGPGGLASLAIGLESAMVLEKIDISQGLGPLAPVLKTLARLPNLRWLKAADLQAHPTYVKNPGEGVVADPDETKDTKESKKMIIPCESLAIMIGRGLTHLDISSSTGLAGAPVLLDAMAQPGVQIRYFDLSQCEPDENLVAALCRMMVANESVESLRLVNVLFDFDSMERIARSIEQNRTITLFACYGYMAGSATNQITLSTLLCQAIPKTVIQELEIGSADYGFTEDLLGAISNSRFLHRVVVHGPESVTATFLLRARQMLRWKENVARVQMCGARAAIEAWLLFSRRIPHINKDLRRMISGYIWRLRLVWPLPRAADPLLELNGEFTVDSMDHLFGKKPPVEKEAHVEEAASLPRRILKTRGRARNDVFDASTEIAVAETATEEPIIADSPTEESAAFKPRPLTAFLWERIFRVVEVLLIKAFGPLYSGVLLAKEIALDFVERGELLKAIVADDNDKASICAELSKKLYARVPIVGSHPVIDSIAALQNMVMLHEVIRSSLVLLQSDPLVFCNPSQLPSNFLSSASVSSLSCNSAEYGSLMSHISNHFGGLDRQESEVFGTNGDDFDANKSVPDFKAEGPFFESILAVYKVTIFEEMAVFRSAVGNTHLMFHPISLEGLLPLFNFGLNKELEFTARPDNSDNGLFFSSSWSDAAKLDPQTDEGAMRYMMLHKVALGKVQTSTTVGDDLQPNFDSISVPGSDGSDACYGVHDCRQNMVRYVIEYKSSL